jgi:hypothetical protein
LYGLKESPSEWSSTWTSFLLGIGLKRSTIDWNLFFRKESNGTVTRLGVHVDDGLLAAHKDVIQPLLNDIKRRFDIEVQFDIKDYLGYELVRKREELKIGVRQLRYIEKVAKLFQRETNFENTVHQSTPLLI